MMNAAYLVDNVALLSLQEKQDGVEFHCFDMDTRAAGGRGTSACRKGASRHGVCWAPLAEIA